MLYVTAVKLQRGCAELAPGAGTKLRCTGLIAASQMFKSAFKIQFLCVCIVCTAALDWCVRMLLASCQVWLVSSAAALPVSGAASQPHNKNYNYSELLAKAAAQDGVGDGVAQDGVGDSVAQEGVGDGVALGW